MCVNYTVAMILAFQIKRKTTSAKTEEKNSLTNNLYISYWRNFFKYTCVCTVYLSYKRIFEKLSSFYLLFNFFSLNNTKNII